MPAPLVIRPALLSDAAAWARVNVDGWRTAYRGIVPEENLARQTYGKVEEMFRNLLAKGDPNVCNFVAALEGEGVVGIATGGPNRLNELPYGGELWGIYVRQEHQRRGIGRKLVAAVARGVLVAGYGSMIVQVLEANPSRRFYEAMGGVPLEGRFEYDMYGISLPECIYAWTDLPELVRRLEA